MGRGGYLCLGGGGPEQKVIVDSVFEGDATKTAIALYGLVRRAWRTRSHVLSFTVLAYALAFSWEKAGE